LETKKGVDKGFQFRYVAIMETENQHPISRYREAKGLTLEAFGALVGVQKAAVSKWEAGKGPKPSLVIEIERVTGGELPRHELRPDLWEAPASQPEEAA
jgi:transcriptional regulator with XRE-family HTH domain